MKIYPRDRLIAQKQIDSDYKDMLGQFWDYLNEHTIWNEQSDDAVIVIPKEEWQSLQKEVEGDNTY